MANPTSNFGWQMPTPVDLVTDLPADFEVFGQAVDSSLADLKGGTSGQVLSKNSNTDMDFVWVTSDDANAIQNTIVDAKADLITATAADTPARLAVGANDLVLSADSAEVTGLKYTGDWTSYTPTLTNLTLGNGALTARWRQIGKIVDVRFTFQLGSTSAVGNDPTFTLPKTSVVTSIPFNAYFQDAGTATYVGFLNLGSTTATFYSSNSNGVYTTYSGVGSGSPFTWTTNDFLQVLFSYEVA
jgi:hypothetical protein